MKLSELFEGLFETQDQIYTQNFKNWFGNWEHSNNASKVVDASGKPLRVYHGTGTDIHAFNPKDLNIPNTDHVLDIGIHFSVKHEPANKYALNVSNDDSHIRKYSSETSSGKHPTVYPVYLNIRKLLDLTKPLPSEFLNAINHLAKIYNLENAVSKISKNKQQILNVLSIIQRKGGRKVIKDLVKHYDGIKYHLLGSECYVVFNPNNIKSAIGNNGNFSTHSNNINENLTLLEYPQYVKSLSDHRLNNPKGNREMFDEYIKIIEPLEQLNDDIIIYHRETPKIGTYIAANPKKKQILYFMQYRNSGNPTVGKFVYQSFLWIDKNYRHSVGSLPSRFFYELVDDYFTIATDGEQTLDGKKWWLKRIKEAFQKNLKVYYLNQFEDFLIPLNSPEDVEIYDRKYQIYTEDESSQDKLFLISSKTFKPSINI